MIKKPNTGDYLLIVIFICVLFIVYSKVNEYWIKHTQDKYGFSYNEERKRLGIPIIPSDWHIKQREKDWIWWTGAENEIGHKRKTVMFSGIKLDGELDVYGLSPKEGRPRLFEIEYKFDDKYHIDSVSYTYQIDHTATTVSKKITDSILTAEKIKKDY